MYFGIFYLLNLLTIKLIFWKNHSLLAYGFYMKHNQNKIIFLVSYNLSSFDMKFLAYGVSRHYNDVIFPSKILAPLLNLTFMVQRRPVPILMLWSQFEQLLILTALLFSILCFCEILLTTTKA